MNPPPTVAHHSNLLVAMFILLGGVWLGGASLWMHWNNAATCDEPLHLVAAHTIRFQSDYRVNPEDPCLWQRWVALALSNNDLHPDYTTAEYEGIVDDTMTHASYVVDTLYKTPGVVAEVPLRKGRAMMAVVAAALVWAVSAFAWRLAGRWAGLIAVALMAIDPNLLGHAALIKNDLAVSLCYVLTTWATWRACQRPGLWSALALGTAVGCGMTVKFSGLLLPACAAAGLLVAAIAAAWQVRSQPTLRRVMPLVRAALTWAGAMAVAVTVIWTVHGWRFEAVPGRPGAMNIDRESSRLKINRAFLQTPQPQDLLAAADKLSDPMLFHAVRWGLARHALPEVWLKGLAYTYFSADVRLSYFMGQENLRGSPWYFWGAGLFKTPLGVLTLLVATVVLVCRMGLWRSRAAMVLGASFAVYMAAAMGTAMNLGLRHVFPMYALAYVAAGVSIAAAAAAVPWSRARRVLVAVVAGCGALAAVETALFWPNYIGFFNWPARAAGPLNLLSDSNVDWGQDVAKLADWQNAHPGVPLYVAMFGAAPPEYFGVEYFRLSGTETSTRPKSRGGPGVWAVSAPLLQGLYAKDEAKPAYRALLKRKPLAVLGCGIYLYEVGKVKEGATTTAPSPTPAAP